MRNATLPEMFHTQSLVLDFAQALGEAHPYAVVEAFRRHGDRIITTIDRAAEILDDAQELERSHG